MQEPVEPIRGEAIRTLRKGVVMGSTLIALAIAVQLLTWSFSSFTSIRYARIEERVDTHEPVVVVSQGRPLGSRSESGSESNVDASSDPGTTTSPPSTQTQSTETAPADVNRISAPANTVLQTAHQLALFLGVFGLLMLVPQVWAGLVILAGATGGRMQRATAALQWTIVLTVMCIPWRDWFIDLPVGGMLTSFSTMSVQAEAYSASAAGAPAAAVFYAQFLVLPVAGFFAAVIVAFSFHQGVDGAVLQADLVRQEMQIDKEASNREAGSVVYGGRASGAFRAALDHEDEEPADSASGSHTNGQHARTLPMDAPLQAPASKKRQLQPVGAAAGDDGDHEDDNGRRPI